MLIFRSTEQLPHSETREYITGLLSEQDILLIHGGSGEGKSLFTLSLCHALACKDTFLDFPIVNRPPTILIIDGESTMQTLSKRLSLYKNKMIYMGLYVKNNVLKEAVEIREFFEGKTGLIVLDNVTCLTSFDQNSQVEIESFKEFVMNLRNDGFTVIVIHHSNKAGNYAGTSVLSRFPSIVLKQKKVEDNTFSLVLEKMRDHIPTWSQKSYQFGSDGTPVVINWEKPDKREGSLSVCVANLIKADPVDKNSLKELLIIEGHVVTDAVLNTTLYRLLKKGEIQLIDGIYSNTGIISK